MKRIKLVYVISSLGNLGPVNVLYNMIKYIDFNLFEVYVISLIPEGNNSRFSDFEVLPIHIIQISKDKKSNLFSLYFKMRSVINIINPHIIHTHCLRSKMLAAFLSKRYYKIETAHIYPGLQFKKMKGLFIGTVFIWLSNCFTRLFDCTVSCSESVAESYKENQDFDTVAIPNGCSLPVNVVTVAEKQQLRKKLCLNVDLRYFIFIGRFSPEKNPDLLINAFRQLNNKGIGIILLGEGPLYDSLKHCECTNIMMPGFKSNVIDYLKASDFYISASDVEGLANTLLESMSIGLPSVLSEIPSHREVLNKSDLPMGYTFRCHDQTDLVSAITNVSKLDYETTSCNIRKIYSDYYTAEKMSLSYQDLYKRTINLKKVK